MLMSLPSDKLTLLDYLQRAAESDLGLELEFLSTADSTYFRQRLSQVRKDNPEYRHLALIAKAHKLWIAKREDTPDVEDTD